MKYMGIQSAFIYGNNCVCIFYGTWAHQHVLFWNTNAIISYQPIKYELHISESWLTLPVGIAFIMNSLQTRADSTEDFQNLVFRH